MKLFRIIRFKDFQSFFKKHVLLVLLFIFLFFSASAMANSDNLMSPDNGHFYQYFSMVKTWHDAKNFCYSVDSHLATISTPEENQFVYEIGGSRQSVWLGGTDEGAEGVWRWVTGEPWIYENWPAGEPNGGTSENYLTWIYGSYWNDFGDGSANYFNHIVCEWEFPHCSPSYLPNDFKQLLEPWSGDPYGEKNVVPPTETIGNKGCALCSAANILSYHSQLTGGPSVDPRQLNNWLRELDQNTDGIIGYAGLEIVWPAVVYLAKTKPELNIDQFYWSGFIEFRDDLLLHDWLCINGPQVLRVKSNSGKEHYVATEGVEKWNNLYTWLIKDPGSHSAPFTLSEGYGNEYNEMRTFSVVPSSPLLTIITYPTIPFLVTDPQGRKTGIDPDTGATYKEIPDASYVSESLANPQNPDDISPTQYAFELFYPQQGGYTVQLSDPDSNIEYRAYFIGFDEADSPSTVIKTGNLTSGSTSTYIVHYSSTIGTKIEVEQVGSSNSPPQAQCSDVSVSTEQGVCYANASVDNGSYDPDGDQVTFYQSPAGPYEIGETEITLTVTDSYGESNSCTAVVSVVDEAPPKANLTVSPDTLWPPNHKMINVNPLITVNDNCDSDPEVRLASITMNEDEGTNTYDPNYDDTVGDGYTTGDIHVEKNGNVFLRAERSGTGSGRVYTLIYEATDDSGNVATATATVTVPHDMD